jgi:ferrous iron transport protein B
MEHQRDARVATLENERAGKSLRASYGGRLGQLIEQTIELLGFDWQIGIGLLSAFASREVSVSTMGVVYGIGEDVDEESVGLRQRIQQAAHSDGRPIHTSLVGLSLGVFFAIACHCMSALAIVKRETRSWTWPTFLFVYTGALAWLLSFAVFQGGVLLGFG